MGRLIIIYFVILIGIFSCQKQYPYDKINEIINDTRLEFAPDVRTAVFDIEVISSDPLVLKGETNIPHAKTSLIRLIERVGIPFEDQITLLPGDDVGNLKYGIINVSVANLRSQPRHSSELVSQALLGTPMNILKQSGGWLLVQTPDQYISWTNAESLVRKTADQLESWKKEDKIIYLTTYGFALDTLGNNHVSDLVAGNILSLVEEYGDSWKVSYPDGRKAKIAKNEAKLFRTWYDHLENSDQSITHTAMDLTGVPYLWGGTSSKGVDCSGFTKTIYFLHGMILPRDASQQVLVGELVDAEKDFSNLKTGDLLFFGKVEDDQSEKVVHVGLWLGNNRFIHASGDVHISSMDSLDKNFDLYNYNRYLRSKRIIGTPNSTKKNLLDVY